jgi:esterase/lipase
MCRILRPPAKGSIALAQPLPHNIMSNHIVYHPALLPGKTAVTLVTHGLNLKPDAMLPLINWLREHGSDVYLVQLSGHHKGGMDIKEVTSSVWQMEMLEGYRMAKKASLEGPVPLFFLGYSLGALLGQSMIALSGESTPFDKQILLAPAFAIRPRSYLVKLLFFLGKHRNLPSYTPKGYRVNESLPLHIYDILFREERRVLTSGFNQTNIPALVIIDPRDELVSYQKLRKQVNRFGLTNYRLIILDHSLKARNQRYHHLIIDERTMGKRNWEMVIDEINRFLFLC